MSLSTSSRNRNHLFDLVRILAATAVLLGHAPELSDGNRSREILARLTAPSVTFGVLGVDVFFLLSGYLIVKSWLSRPQLFDYMKKRLLRIAPGYAAAMLVVGLVVGCVAPGVPHFFHQWGLRHFVLSALFIYNANNPTVYPGNHYQILNGSLWTIPYEFNCYLVVAFIGLFRGFRNPKLWLALGVISMARWTNFGFLQHLGWPREMDSYLGSPLIVARFMTIFCIGGCFYLFRDRIRFRPVYALLCAIGMGTVGWLHLQSIELWIVLPLAYLLFHAGSAPTPWLDWMAKVPDLSYGIYLYGWPVESLLIWRFHPSPWVVVAWSVPICVALAAMSWIFVEGPSMTLGRNIQRKRQVPALSDSCSSVPVPQQFVD